MSECKCGCGGTPNKGKIFIRGHYARTAEAKTGYAERRKKVSGNPSKYCKCGCGGLAPIAAHDAVDRGYRAGQRAFYIVGHAARNKKGPKAPRWKGGRRINGYGYIEVYAPNHPHASKRDKYMQEHRLVMEEHLGRLLDPTEERVHHINGDRTDNRLGNLVVLSRSDHAKFHVSALAEWRKKNPEKAKESSRRGGIESATIKWGNRE